MDILKTRKQKLEGEISALKDELSSESLSEAEKKYRDKVISLRVCFFVSYRNSCKWLGFKLMESIYTYFLLRNSELQSSDRKSLNPL